MALVEAGANFLVLVDFILKLTNFEEIRTSRLIEFEQQLSLLFLKLFHIGLVFIIYLSTLFVKHLKL